ncbi:hypothetical protein [Streptomyces sp. NBC_00620]|uniref:hypothetical protein n=1 Tax=Streptomyces sp. NBC_00620 TaxID=2903666 RepID=UPI00225AFD30|nr:hypothetical protein [Streptomyces sp. NBC_00620]MCX4974273.1 hypothetical protein [Streptomyces sp. NBC_00620]
MTATSAPEYLGAGVLGLCALALVWAAARLGESQANASADAALAAHRDQQYAPAPAHAPSFPPLDIPPLPVSPPADPAYVETLQLHQVQAFRRARHRKEPACT